TAYPDTLTQEELIAQLRQTDRSRVVVYKKTLDHPLGFLLVKEILLNPATPWREKLREPLLVPLRARLLDLLKKFRYTKSKMALLVDEFGGVSGMITLHDLLEEIVGDIRERHEPARADFQKIAEGFWIASGHMNRGDLAAELDVKFPEDLGTTAGGFIMNSLGHVPSPGDELHWNGFIFKVARMAGRRITQIEIRRATPPTEPADSESQPKGGSD
ncbi:CBS domain-containing protein, partial [Candidatus Sumerlaeota bacterium]|nr:CBS domain-containing protein [Candidatus Sumerlaeota bacterium]